MSIIDHIKQIIRTEVKITRRTAIVQRVDTSKKTCVVKLTNGAIIEDVRLNAVESPSTCITLYPEVGSNVIVDMVDGSDNDYTISSTSALKNIEISCNGNITINGGKNNGLVKIAELVKKLNQLEQKLAAHQHTYINAAGTPTPTTPDPSGSAVIQPVTMVSDLENKKVTH